MKDYHIIIIALMVSPWLCYLHSTDIIPIHISYLITKNDILITDSLEILSLLDCTKELFYIF